MELTKFIKKAAKLKNFSNYKLKYAQSTSELIGFGQTSKNTDLLASNESEFITSLLKNKDKVSTRTAERSCFPLEYEPINYEHKSFANEQMLNNDLVTVTSGPNDLNLTQITCMFTGKSTDLPVLPIETNEGYPDVSFITIIIIIFSFPQQIIRLMLMH